MDPHSLRPPARCRRGKGGGPAVVEAAAAAAAALARAKTPVRLDQNTGRRCNPFVRRFHGFQNAISFGREHNKQAQFASGGDSPSSGDDGSSSPDGPPVLTILAGVIVFLLVLWVIGSIVTWIVGLVFGAAKS